MGVRGFRDECARRAIGLLCTLQLLCGCEANGDQQAGTPGLEPPKMTSDAGGPVPAPVGGSGSAPVTPGDSSGNPGMSGGEFGGASGAGPGSAGVGGAGGAGAALDDADGGVALGPDDALFTGLWVIDQPAHALYEATLYELGDDGEISVLETMLDGAEPWPGFVTGTVSSPDGSKRCQFEGTWRSVQLRVVELDAACTDGLARGVQIELPDADVTSGVMPIVRWVDGQTGWQHPGWTWSWRKCESRDDCLPF